MEIAATVINSGANHEVRLRTGTAVQSLEVLPKPDANGSAINGGEFLMSRDYRKGLRSSRKGARSQNPGVRRGWLRHTPFGE